MSLTVLDHSAKIYNHEIGFDVAIKVPRDPLITLESETYQCLVCHNGFHEQRCQTIQQHTRLRVKGVLSKVLGMCWGYFKFQCYEKAQVSIGFLSVKLPCYIETPSLVMAQSKEQQVMMCVFLV